MTADDKAELDHVGDDGDRVRSGKQTRRDAILGDFGQLIQDFGGRVELAVQFRSCFSVNGHGHGGQCQGNYQGSRHFGSSRCNARGPS